MEALLVTGNACNERKIKGKGIIRIIGRTKGKKIDILLVTGKTKPVKGMDRTAVTNGQRL